MQKLAVLVPTRNRAELAINAVRSMLTWREGDFRVVISDNSSRPDQGKLLSDFVGRLGDDRLSFVRPPREMAMAEHWDWALKSVMAISGVSHIGVLTDRMLFKTGCIEQLLAIVERYEDRIVSYDHDRIVDHRLPITVELSPWSDEVLNVDAALLLELSAKCNFPSALPRLLNCVCPRSILEAHVEKYGTVASSMSPDYNFCYRSLALVESIAYWDRSPIVHYALATSNGESTARGVATETSADFVSLVGSDLFRSVPCPSVRTVRNAILHEYCVVRGESGSSKFHGIETNAYTAMLQSEIDQMENRDTAMEMATRLSNCAANHGRSLASANQDPVANGRVRRIVRRLKIGPLLLRMRQVVSRRLPTGPRGENAPHFANIEQASAFALTHNGERQPSSRLKFSETAGCQRVASQHSQLNGV